MRLSCVRWVTTIAAVIALRPSAHGDEKTRPAPTRANVADAELKPMQGRVLYFQSELFGDPQPLAVCTTSISDEPKPLLVDLVPGTLSGLDRAARSCEQICRIASEHGLDCVALRPAGRGDGSVYQGYGEVDVFEAIEAVGKLVSIDPDRISLSGVSMGGAATWYHASHYPGFWSAAAPFCGYCDYRLWEKPGGTTFHRQPWEEFSWISRGAAYRPGNLRHTALRIIHGQWDRAVGGGVPVEHSRQMHRLLTRERIPNAYIELPETGHGARTRQMWEETVPWLLRQTRVKDPDRVSLTVHTLRHNRSHWVSVAQQVRYGAPSMVEGSRDRRRAALEVQTTNVRRLTLGSMPQAAETHLKLDGTTIASIDLSEPKHLVRNTDGSWRIEADGIPQGQKQPGLSGPFADLFLAPTVVVYGTSGTAAEKHFNRLMAQNAQRLFRELNGGVHRGGIQGDNAVQLPVVSDREMLELIDGGQPKQAGLDGIVVNGPLLERANLFLVGNFTSNAVLALMADRLPVRFGAGTVELGGKSYHGNHLAFYAVLPHPDGKRYVALLAGSEPDAICWGSHVGLQLLPDFLVFDHDRVVDWGFWDNHWRHAD